MTLQPECVTASNTALLLIGFQNDFFAPDGVLHQVIQASVRATGVLEHTVSLVEQLRATSMLIVSTPIVFSPDYSELVEPVGILKTIQELGAFRAGTRGCETVPELLRFGDRILEVPGKRGLNAFSNTDLATVLDRHRIRHVVLSGVVTSICIDSTGRSAHERGNRVTVLSDCTGGRTLDEHEFYCRHIFPLYAQVMDASSLVATLRV